MAATPRGALATLPEVGYQAPAKAGVMNERARDREAIVAGAMKLAVAGGAGLVGQNLILRLIEANQFQIAAIDKHAANLKALRALSPHTEAVEADMAEPGDWERAVADCDALVLLQAQIGGVDPEPFRRNNIVATERALDAARKGGRCSYIVHVSSSVVNSMARDLCVESKKAQEAIRFKECDLPQKRRIWETLCRQLFSEAGGP